MIINVALNQGYDIVVEEGSLGKVKDLVNVNRKVLAVTDTGVPAQHVDALMFQLPQGELVVVEAGEGSKSFKVLEELCRKMLDNSFHREDLVIALGGGVVGDLAGFAAASYMRGIDFVNIPTTTLSQIDSSIGGKTAINLDKTKNIVGAFHQPSKVIIDTKTLSTLSRRHVNNGLVEALKAGLIYDEELFNIFADKDIDDNLTEIIIRSLRVKKDVVEKDEKEADLRKILNFGHTIGHGLESIFELSGLLHGEAVAVGMLPMIEESTLRAKVKSIINDKLGIATDVKFDKEAVFEAMLKDKKAHADSITVVKVAAAGIARLEKISLEKCRQLLDKAGE